MRAAVWKIHYMNAPETCPAEAVALLLLPYLCACNKCLFHMIFVYCSADTQLPSERSQCCFEPSLLGGHAGIACPRCCEARPMFWQADLHLLLKQRKAGRLGRQLAPTREAQHVLKLCVPGNAVGILVLGEQGLGLHAVNLHRVVVIHHCQLPTAAAQIQTPAGKKDFERKVRRKHISCSRTYARGSAFEVADVSNKHADAVLGMHLLGARMSAW